MEKNSKRCSVCITEYTSEWEHLGPDMKSLKCCTGEPTFFSLEKKDALGFQRDSLVLERWYSSVVLKALAVLREDAGLVPSIHIVAHNGL